jgi:tRNA (adenine22-N1)-methyltransferase
MTDFHSIKLSERLRTIAGFIEKGAAVADIGTDHGYLPVFLAQNSLARRIIASDVSAASLETARRSAVKYGVEDKITFVNAPGLSGADKSDIDTIIVAGMGGETIIGILSDAPWTTRKGVRLVLQPQTKKDLLCSWLFENDYEIYESTQAYDNGRLYTIIFAGGKLCQL